MSKAISLYSLSISKKIEPALYPAPLNLSRWWRFGSLLSLCLGIQLISGLLLAIHYTNNVEHAFRRVIHICRDINYGWLIRTLHTNGASFFFICLYLHIGRGIYYHSYRLTGTWTIGVILLFIIIATAFLGYVLPWGQISFWGATVITSLLSSVPYLGEILTQWLWGGFSVDNPTLTRFFTFHFCLPFIISALVGSHIISLHQTGSNNPLGSSSSLIPFHSYYTLKDIVGFLIIIIILTIILIYTPDLLGDPENFNPANTLVTPLHIQPEWYYLFAYTILRAIPNKLGGVLFLVASIAILLFLPFIKKKERISSNLFYPLNQLLFWVFITIVLLLTWIGARSVERPYIETRQFLTTFYFSYFLLNRIVLFLWDSYPSKI